MKLDPGGLEKLRSEMLESAAAPERRLGKYVILREVGRGGSGAALRQDRSELAEFRIGGAPGRRAVPFLDISEAYIYIYLTEMDIRRFSSMLQARGLRLFGTRDLAILFPGRDPRLAALQLHQWTRKGWVARLKRGLYELAWPEPSPVPDLVVANRLYEPSYVSLETALSHYQIIPEVAAQVTSVTPKPTRRFRNAHGLFTYFTVRPAAFAGVRLVDVQGMTARIADPEKAVVDRLYAAVRRGEGLDVVHGRWERRRLRRLDRKKLRSYARLCGAAAPKVEERIDALLG